MLIYQITDVNIIIKIIYYIYIKSCQIYLTLKQKVAYLKKSTFLTVSLLDLNIEANKYIKYKFLLKYVCSLKQTLK